MKHSPGEIDFEYQGQRLRLQRINDRRHRAWSNRSISIEADYSFWYEMIKQNQNIPNLAQFYATFQAAFGESGQVYDDWKGAFNFAFKVDIFKDKQTIPYLLNVVNWRSAVEFRFKKIIALSETHFDRMLVYEPFEQELSREQMNRLSAYLYGYAERFWQTSSKNQTQFVKEVASNLILFGYADDTFFQQHYEDEEQFRICREQMREA